MTSNVIPPPDAEKPFVIGETLTVCEAAMVYAGRHPHGVFLADASLENWEIFLGREADRSRRKNARRSHTWDIYRTILAEIAAGRIIPQRAAYLSTGVLDPRFTVIRASDLVSLADRRFEDRKFLRELPRRELSHSGAPGRPSSMALILAEFEQRKKANLCLKSLCEEARYLSKWKDEQHPKLPKTTPKTIENRIRHLFPRSPVEAPK
jgi:hypothetical protein